MSLVPGAHNIARKTTNVAETLPLLNLTEQRCLVLTHKQRRQQHGQRAGPLASHHIDLVSDAACCQSLWFVSHLSVNSALSEHASEHVRLRVPGVSTHDAVLRCR
jgi:hypothetical protein